MIRDLGEQRPPVEIAAMKRAARGAPPPAAPAAPAAPTDLSAWAESAAHAERVQTTSHRLGGTAWTPARPLPAGQAARKMLLEPADPAPRAAKRRGRRRWYRRPLVVAPLVLLLLIAGSGAAVLLRLESTMAEIRSVSQPPPVVSLSDEVGQPEVSVDTAPAQLALIESGAAPAEGDGGGLFGRFQDGASNVGDMAGAAVSLAGIAESAETGPITMLVMGVDARPGAPIDVGVKADALMVVSLDPAAGDCRMLSIPRDTRAELPGYGPSKVNHALLVGGVPYQKLVVEELLGIPLDYYVLVDFAAFQQVVDVVGGVRVDVPTEIIHTNGDTLFEAGPQTLDGSRALTYARYRDSASDGDIGRIQRQLAILRGLAASTATRDLAGDVANLLPAIEDHVRTDLTAEEMTGLARSLDGKCTATTVESDVLEGTRLRLDDPILRQNVSFNVVDDAQIQAHVRELLGEPLPDPAAGPPTAVGPLARRLGPTPLSAR